MAKSRHDETQTSSKTAMALLSIGGLAVAGLLVWALTRTVQPAPEPVASTEAPVTTIEPPTSGAFPTVTPPTGTTATAPGPIETTATSTVAPIPPSPAEDPNTVARTSVADLRSKIDSRQVTVIDVRDKTSYMGSHIPGALHVPAAQVESQVSYLPKDKPIVTYCT